MHFNIRHLDYTLLNNCGDKENPEGVVLKSLNFSSIRQLAY